MDDHSRVPNAARESNSTPHRRSTARALGIGLTFLAFVLAFLWLRDLPFEDSTQERDRTAVPNPPPERASRVTPAERNDALLSNVRDESLADRLVREPLPYQHLLVLARTLPEAAIEGGDVLARSEDDPLRSLLASPASFRGRPFIARGRLLALADQDDSGHDETRGTLVTDFGQLVAFSVIGRTDLRIGERVRVAGLFFKIYADEASPGDYDPKMIYLVGRTLERSFDSLAADQDLAAIPFDEAQDRTLSQLIDWPQEIVLRTLQYLRTVPPQARTEWASEEVEWSELRRDPDRFRGRLVRVVATASPTLEWNRSLLPSDVEQPTGRSFAEGLLRLPNERWFRFIGLEGIPIAVTETSRQVALEGIFIKNLAWQDRRGDVLCAPLIVASRFDAVPESTSAVAPGLSTLFLVLGSLCAALFMLGAFADRRDAERFRNDYLRRKRRKLERQLVSKPVAYQDTERAP